ncbi:MAG: SHOCT domain-containing protein [Planctomycetota bacterium]
MPTPAPADQPEMSLASQPLVDLSGLDANEASGVRRLRQILIGCGVCQKTIKIPESKLGKTTACSACGVVLKVDAFNLAKAKGDLIDMTHLELDKADLLLDGGSHGSTLGGSSIQFGPSSSTMGTGGYELNAPASGSMSGVSLATDSQSQMRELRELNDLKHSGQITSAEYRERKKEIYAGKTLAIQAMSRSAGGDGNRPVIKRDDKPALLPKPVLALIALLIFAGGGYAGWSVMNGPASSPGGPTTVASPADTGADEESLQTAIAANTETADVDAEQSDIKLSVNELDAGNALLVDAGDETAGGGDGEEASSPDQAVPVSLTDESVTILELDPVSDENAEAVGDRAPTPAVPMAITAWPTTWPTHTLGEDDRSAIGKACEVLQRMSVRDDSATIGVAVGPAATDFDSPVYRSFRRSMQNILTETAEADQVLDDLNIRTSDRTALLGTLESHRLHVTSKSNRDVRATILTGIQDGYCVSYWFAGSKTLYSDFLDTVGRAEFAPRP